jgi:hypothetical protein
MSYLTDNAKKIIADITLNHAILRHNSLLFSAFQDNLDPLFEDRLAAIKDPKGKADFIVHKDLPNYFKKCVQKLSQVYTFDVNRIFSSNPAELEVLLKKVNFNLEMHKANQLCNTTKSCLVELYHNKKTELKMRAIPNDRFWVWTDDTLDPTVPRVYVKMIRDLEVPKELRNKFFDNKLYYLYTDEEVLEWESIGRSHKEAKPNPLGFAPFVYISYDDYNLIPEKNTAAEGLAIGPGFSLTQVNVAAWYQGHPLRVFKNIDKARSTFYAGYDGAIVLNSEEGSGKDPEFSEVPSSLDIGKMLDLIKFKVEDYFYTMNCPIKKDASNDKSGLSLMIEGVDTLEARKNQMLYFKPADEAVVKLVAKYHNWLIQNKTADLPKNYPKTSIDEDLDVETEFTLPSTEAEQAKASNGEDKPVAESTNNEEKPNGKPAESAPKDTEGN